MVNAQPSFLTKLNAWMAREISAADLEALQSSGSMVYPLLKRAEDLHISALIGEQTPWTVSPSDQAQLLATWCGYVLQTLGDEFLKADYAYDPNTKGFVPEVTAQQVMAFFEPVEGWISRARQATVNPEYRLDVALPERLPEWSEVEPCPRAHLAAMLAAAQALRVRTQTASATFKEKTTSEHKRDLDRVCQLLEAADTAAESAAALWSGSYVSEEMHERIERSVKSAIADYFLAGQYMAMPSLIASGLRQPAKNAASQPRRLPLPTEPGFDPWCLTDPHTKAAWKRDRAAVAAIRSLWEYDSNPEATLAIQAEINLALEQGNVAFSENENGSFKGNYFCCPWSAVYRVINPLKLGGKWLRRNQEFVFDVSAEEIAEGGKFKRKILKGDFSPTDEVDYCDPESGGHHDD